MPESILTLNAGSSSLKLGVFTRDGGSAVERARAAVTGLGRAPKFEDRSATGYAAPWMSAEDGPNNAGEALDAALGWVGRVVPLKDIVAVGHRVVHGGPDYAAPLVLDAATRAALERFVPLAPLHQPHNLAGVDAAATALPHARQVACFDTAFHRQHPWVADTFALPRRFYDEGVRRYGFHGLSYEYITAWLADAEPALHAGRVIVAHLGNGASMCAVKAGRSIGSTMGFTALDGLPMGTRCGQIDPGVVLYLMAERAMSAAEISDLLYRESGLKGLSGLAGDMRALEASEAPEAADAIAYFTHRIRREIGAMAAVLEGVDAIVFTGGIGENSARVRAEVCAQLGWLGVTLDAAANAAQARVISAPGSAVTVLRASTDEEAMIARHAARAVVAGAQ